MSQYYQKDRYSRNRRPEVYGQMQPGSDPILLEVVLRDGESVESLIKRFLRKFKKSRLADEIKAHGHYVKPSVTRRLAKARRKQIAQKITKANCPQQSE